MFNKHLALMRGLNLGAHNRISSANLAKVFEESGANEVKTYLQSGNVIFTCEAGKVEKVQKTAVEKLFDHFGKSLPIVFRSASEYAVVIERNPFLAKGVDERELHLMFLAGKPTPEALAKLEREKFLPDEFEVDGREIYLRIPGSVADTKLTNQYFDSRLKTVSTGRNWKTVVQLGQMLS